MQLGRAVSKLKQPTGISIDIENIVYVSEFGNNHISVFTCEGKFLTSFGTQGSGPGQIRSPCGIAVDKNGLVYVCDFDNNRLQIF